MAQMTEQNHVFLWKKVIGKQDHRSAPIFLSYVAVPCAVSGFDVAEIIQAVCGGEFLKLCTMTEIPDGSLVSDLHDLISPTDFLDETLQSVRQDKILKLSAPMFAALKNGWNSNPSPSLQRWIGLIEAAINNR